MVLTLEQDIFIGMAYFRTGNFDVANGWQYSTEHGRCISLISTNFPRASCYLKRRFHGGFTSVARWAWKPLDQWEHSF
jgi:hypothetical protein